MQTIASKLDDYGGEATKLQERMVAAEKQYHDSIAQLRSARQQMQRLSASLSAGERSANSMVKELRQLSPKVENVLQLRGEVSARVWSTLECRFTPERRVSLVARNVEGGAGSA
eukprot:365743-Chlamydomonas_euryale.AAC.7